MGEKKKELERGEIYRGPCGVLRESNWLSAEVLPTDRDTIVEIEAVIRRKNVEFRTETKHSYGSLKFKGATRELGLNSTHIKVLKALFGPDTSAWFGQSIALYVDDNVSAFGQIVSAVRIRAKRVDPAAAKKAAARPSDVDRPLSEEEMRDADAKQDAIDAAQKGGK